MRYWKIEDETEKYPLIITTDDLTMYKSTYAKMMIELTDFSIKTLKKEYVEIPESEAFLEMV